MSKILDFSMANQVEFFRRHLGATMLNLVLVSHFESFLCAAGLSSFIAGNWMILTKHFFTWKYKMATLTPQGKQDYCLPMPDKSPRTNTSKVSISPRHQSHSDLWQAGLSWCWVVHRPPCEPVNTFLRDWLPLRGNCCLFCCFFVPPPSREKLSLKLNRVDVW